ncbi:MAG: hypothetical protein PVG66_12720 [Chromatiales bacterium]|jgi:hypothetical protein
MTSPSTRHPGKVDTQTSGMTSTPTWLELPANLPAWLLPRQPEFPQDILDGLLHYARSGKTLTVFCEDHRIETGTLRQWLHADEYRKARYYDAKAIGAEKIEDEILDIADGSYPGLPQDVQRDALRMKARQYLLGVWNRDRYGEKRQIDVGVTVDISRAMREGAARVERSRLINGEVVADDS